MFTLTDNQKLELIEKHLSNSLSPKEQTVFGELLVKDKDFELSLLFQKDLMPSLQAVSRQDLKLQFQNLERTIVAGIETPSQASVLAKVREGIEAEIKRLGYTVDQFLQLFRPIPNYTTAIAAITRGKSISLISPKNEADFSNEVIRFDFGNALKKDIEILIEDNQYDILIEEEVDSGHTEITLPIPTNDFPAGRYYWKIIEEDELVLMGTFFVRKDLMEGLGGFEA